MIDARYEAALRCQWKQHAVGAHGGEIYKKLKFGECLGGTKIGQPATNRGSKVVVELGSNRILTDCPHLIILEGDLHGGHKWN